MQNQVSVMVSLMTLWDWFMTSVFWVAIFKFIFVSTGTKDSASQESFSTFCKAGRQPLWKSKMQSTKVYTQPVLLMLFSNVWIDIDIYIYIYIYQLYMSRKKCHIIFLKQDIFSQIDIFWFLYMNLVYYSTSGKRNITANITEILLSLSVICLMKKLE